MVVVYDSDDILKILDFNLEGFLVEFIEDYVGKVI